MFRLNKTLPTLFLFWLLVCVSLLAGPKDPVTDQHFQKFLETQNVELQKELSEKFAEKDGFIVSGPLNPYRFDDHIHRYYFLTVKVLCPDIETLKKSIKVITNRKDHEIVLERVSVENVSHKYLPGYRGAIFGISKSKTDGYMVQFLTLQQLRYLIWVQPYVTTEEFYDSTNGLGSYALAVSDYLYQIDLGNLDAPEPKAVEFGLEESFDLYAPAPDYVIAGYQNYKDYLKSHAEIVTSKLSEILAFVPTESGLDRLKSEAPDIAYPNKEFPLLQQEFRKFIRRGGKMSYMRTLTKEVFDTLKTAEYFFAVGLSGNVRFGRELLREEVKRIEAETGQKPARANHAFLFVGEPILTAGAFFIENDGEPKIVEVNTQSGHYFYSNITATIREDVAERSNDYFMTIGHFFRALDSLEIDYYDVLLRKL